MKSKSLLIAIAIGLLIPAVRAVAEPSVGTFGSAALAQGSAVTAQSLIKQPEQEEITAVITAYTSDPNETDDTPRQTASGATVYPGVIACPSRYSFGTKVIFKGVVHTCEDRMNERFDKEGTERFDIWMETKAEARQWGIRTVKATVLYF